MFDLNLSGYNSGGISEPMGGGGMDFLGSLISAGVNLFTADRAAKQADQQWRSNFQMQQDAMKSGLQFRAADARAAEKAYGINALTLLGAQGPSPSAVIGEPGAGSAAMSQAGQDLGRAVAAATAKEDRVEQLKEKLLESQIKNSEADFVSRTLDNARRARVLGQPGTPPGIPYNWRLGGPPDPRGVRKGRPDMFTQYWDNIRGEPAGTLLSAEASQAMQSSAALGISPAVAATLLRYQMFPVGQFPTAKSHYEGGVNVGPSLPY